MVPLVIFVGAGLGALARYGLSTWMQAVLGAAFPWGTLLVNVSGSLLLTVAYGVLEAAPAAPEWRAFLGIGFLGGYTTFSTFSYEALRLYQEGEWERALSYVVASVLLSLLGAALGFRFASNLTQGLLRRG